MGKTVRTANELEDVIKTVGEVREFVPEAAGGCAWTSTHNTSPRTFLSDNTQPHAPESC